MGFDPSAIQLALREDDLDGWLLYDFHGSNPVARRIAGLNRTAKLTTRRWYYLVPASGTPRALVHRIERNTLAHLPGKRRIYSGRAELRRVGGGARRSGAGRAPGRDGVLARVRHPVLVASRRRHRRAHPLPRRRGGVFRRPGATLRSGLGPCGARNASHRVAAPVRHQGSRVRVHPESRGHRDADRVRGPAEDGRVVRGGGPGHRLSAGGRGAGEQWKPSLSAHRRGSPPDSARTDRSARPVGQARQAGRRVRRHHVGRLHRVPRAGRSRRPSSERRARRGTPR